MKKLTIITIILILSFSISLIYSVEQLHAAYVTGTITKIGNPNNSTNPRPMGLKTNVEIYGIKTSGTEEYLASTVSNEFGEFSVGFSIAITDVYPQVRVHLPLLDVSQQKDFTEHTHFEFYFDTSF